MYWTDSTGRGITYNQVVFLGRPAGRMKQLTGRYPMRRAYRSMTKATYSQHCQAESAHEPLDRAVGHGHALSVHLHPDLVSAVDLHVGVPDTLDMGNQFIVTLGACAA
jgi:hypothetical protein